MRRLAILLISLGLLLPTIGQAQESLNLHSKSTRKAKINAVRNGMNVSKLYGNAWRWCNTGLGNVQVGSDNNYDQVTFRFKAQHTGQIDSIRAFWMVSDGPSYSAGNGGIMRCELQADDGSVNHLPSGTALASFQFNANADQDAHTANELLGESRAGDYFGRLYFASPGSVIAGRIYHFVFTNPTANPVTDYWSVNGINNQHPLSPMQPGYSDTDLALLRHTAGGDWAVETRETPIYTAYWTDGYVQGIPWVGLGAPLGDTGYALYSTTNKVRQKIVPSSDHTITAINVLAWKSGNPPAMTVKLQNASFADIKSGTIAAATFAGVAKDDPRWGKYILDAPVTLSAGTTYYVELSCPTGDASNCYYTWSSYDGYNYGFRGDGFPDGTRAGNYGYYTVNGTDWSTNNDDLIIYFNPL